jgi:COMM domain
MTVPLHCLDGEKAPEAIVADLRLVANLPQAARLQFWDALGPALSEPVPDSIDGTLDAFSRTHDVHPNVLGRMLKATRFLVREACARNLDRLKFEEDIVQLCGGALSPECVIIAPILLSRYDAARESLCAVAFRASVADHGYVLGSVEWRIDSVLASSRGNTGGARIAVLTLGYGQGKEEEQLTLHVTREKLEELRNACERMLRS